MRMVHKEEGRAMDDEEVFLSGRVTNLSNDKGKKENYEVDIDMYIKEKS
jgi:hypothetical protein